MDPTTAALGGQTSAEAILRRIAQEVMHDPAPTSIQRIRLLLAGEDRDEKKAAKARNYVDKRAYRVDNVCEILSISRSHFYELRAAGQLETFKLGNRTLVRAEELERLLRDGVEAA
jgi:excisionase family DNA binding protein